MTTIKSPTTPSKIPYIIMCGTHGTYRTHALQLVKHDLDDQLLIIGGDRAYESAIRLVDIHSLDYLVVRNLYFGRHFMFQKIPWRSILNCDRLIVDLNPRNLSVWIILVARRLLSRNTVVWGHVWPRQGMQSKSDIIRSLQRNLADGLLAYTSRQASELAETGYSKPVFVAPNALASMSQMRFDDRSTRNVFVYVGRLIREKKVDVLIRAFVQFACSNEEADLIIVGDGPQHDDLVAIASSSGIAHRIHFLGHISDYEQLRAIYSKAIAAISPGYAGLNITQSLGFGVPVIVSDQRDHSPEIEALQFGINGEMFRANQHEALASLMNGFWIDRNEWRDRGREISRICANTYSTEAMAAGILRALGVSS